MRHNHNLFLSSSQELLSQEISAVRDSLKFDDSAEVYDKYWEQADNELFYVPSQKKYGRVSLHKKKERLDNYEQDVQNVREQMTKEFKKAAKLEKKLVVLLGGYQKRTEALESNIRTLTTQSDEVCTELATFEALRVRELATIPARIEVS